MRAQMSAIILALALGACGCASHPYHRSARTVINNVEVIR